MKMYTNIESDGTGIERDGTGIERDGTGIERDGTGIERDGTGIERDGTGIRRDGTGIRRLSLVASICVSLGMVSSVAFADTANLQISRNNNTITVSWFNDGELYVGRGSALGTQSAIALSKVPFNSSFFNPEVDGSGTGVLVDGSGTGDTVKVDGSGTGATVQVDGSGTGATVQVDGSGTGVLVDGSGTGIEVDGSGTGVTASGQFSYMVEIDMGCQATQATIYETSNYAAVEYIELNQPSISAGVCNRSLQPISKKFEDQ